MLLKERLAFRSTLMVRLRFFNPRELSYIFFGLFLFFGVLIVDDYGISMDEPIQRKHGIVSFEHMNQSLGLFNKPSVYNIDLKTYDYRAYGVLFQLLSYGIEVLLQLENPKNIFLVRHILVFFLFWIATIFFFKLLLYRFCSWRLAIMGTAFLILSPRIFANAFYNPKDLPLLSFCIISAYSLIKFVDTKTVKYVVLHAISTAMAIDTRIVALYIPVVCFLMIVVEWIGVRETWFKVRNYLLYTSLYAILLCFFTILFWPFLWDNPIAGMVYALKHMSNYPWYGSVFFMGKILYPYDLPWYYVPIWIFISVPIMYSLLWFFGFISFVFTLLKKGKALFEPGIIRTDFIVFSLFIIPIVSVILFSSTLYNDWRHLYFVYPFFLYFSLYGFMVLCKSLNKLRSILFRKAKFLQASMYIIMFLYLMGVLVEMIQIHPHENVYFSEVVLGNAEDYFELDYYGLSFRQGIEFVLDNEKDSLINIAYSSFSGINNENIIPYEGRRRLKSCSIDSSTYFITNYHPNLRAIRTETIFPTDQQLVHSIYVNENRILGIYRLRK